MLTRARSDRAAGWPLAAAGGVAMAVAVLAIRDPHRPGSYGYCPLRLLTGLNCPFCGAAAASGRVRCPVCRAACSGSAGPG